MWKKTSSDIEACPYPGCWGTSAITQEGETFTLHLLKGTVNYSIPRLSLGTT